MSNYTEIFGGGGVPIGAIVQGQFAADSNYLPCDGGDYLRSSYPLLDYTGLETFGRSAPATATLPRAAVWSVAYGASLFVAVAPGGVSSYATSPDGVTWTTRTFPINFDASYANVTFANDLFVVGTGTTIYTSPDGINWTLRYTAATSVSKIIYTGVLFFALNPSGAMPTYYTSPDAITWTSRTGSANGPSGIASFRGMYLMCFSGTASGNAFAMSPNGVTNWTQYTPAMASGTMPNDFWIDIAATSAGVYYLGSTAGSLYFSPDGVTGCAVAVGLNTALSNSTPKRAYSVNGSVFVLSGANAQVGMLRDPTALQVLPLNVSGPGLISLAYGAGTVVAVPYSSTASINVLANDMTRFRTPSMRRLTDGDRYYIKAK